MPIQNTERNKARNIETAKRRSLAALDRRTRRISEGHSIHNPSGLETDGIVRMRVAKGLPILAFAKRPWWNQAQHDVHMVCEDARALTRI
jgi:hypothetical protein